MTTTKKKLNAPRLDIEVTAEDIDNAVRKSSSHCMVAEAIKRAMPHVRKVSVDLQWISFTDPSKGQRNHYLTPTPIALAIQDFDEGITPEPVRVRANVQRIRPAGRTKRTVQDGHTPHARPIVIGGSAPVGTSSKRKLRLGNRREFGKRVLGGRPETKAG